MTDRGESRPRVPGRFVSSRSDAPGGATGAVPQTARPRPGTAPPPAPAQTAKPTPAPAKSPPATAAAKRSAPGRTGTIPRQGLRPGGIAALVVSLGWLGLVGWVVLTRADTPGWPTRNDPLVVIVAGLVMVLPVALLWIAAAATRSARRMRDEGARLEAAIDALRRDDAERQRVSSAALRQAVEARIAEVVRAQAVLAAEVAAIRGRAAREHALPLSPRPAAPQVLRAVDPQPGVAPLPPEDFIRALDFPRDEHDAEGFRVLREALEHPTASLLATAAQDLLTLLAQDGIHMDDLTVHAADAVLWRALADGMRGSDVAALGGIRDRSSLALAGGRMTDDPVFRDAVHHFLQVFARVFAEFAAEATDAEIMRFADTRTARVYMLCARIAGVFA